jgi:hypothetical protein
MKMVLKEERKWLEFAQDRVQWRNLLLAMLDLEELLRECWIDQFDAISVSLIPTGYETFRGKTEYVNNICIEILPRITMEFD